MTMTAQPRSFNSLQVKKIYQALFSHFGPQHWWPGNTMLEISVGAILTQNTAWINVEKAIQGLKKEKKLSIKSLHSISPDECARIIRPAGYYNIKAQRLKNFIAMLKQQSGGSLRRLQRLNIEQARQRLLSVNGIGKETADSIILYALEKPVFVIDAYTRRILSRHGFIQGNEEYDELRRMIERLLTPDVQLYNEYHALIVMTGKNYCKTQPRCSKCPLNKIPRMTK